ncbi:SUMF1/EgtB/PvdO family nonheme iron enzyme [Paraconexibacter antarcticus]|uniref:SUMF1/EgtB/PvdO family nonheme iron enzyme n=1 Tax=Paraconexibacter antarcticus TaxID=2949664 RepID=A0ABY5DZZ6_9ACTN|nr:SUMF1/EgtB/PvdO family nonheme iron enzyme [Paraconexibacter antarcticus]UTI66412.1 SUMF1/EgtB/PvdO family nonheme iron enzyme [Paraconexibacter antarcticus]
MAISPRPSAADVMATDLEAVRARTRGLVAHLSTADLERQIDPILSPLVWDLGHIAAYEDLWLVHRHGGHDLLHGELAALYDAFETPRAVRGDLAILGHADALRYLDDVRARTLAVMDARGVDPVLHEMVLRHELQHTETMLQAMEVAGLLPPHVAGPAAGPGVAGPEWLEIPAGPLPMGAAAGVFAYDNERPVRHVEVPAFRIARRPVTSASWLTFTEGGGYVRREWWSDEGWAWKEDQDINGDHVRADGPSGTPVCHVSWFEAEAFARSVGARLPTEAEWEKAASLARRPAPSSPIDPLEGVGQVWEWTSSEFSAYPGFRAHPYREYSEVFFDRGYRVLRGGSWAADPRVATTTFRNWDLPQRSQIFSGVRLAADAVPTPSPPPSRS